MSGNPDYCLHPRLSNTQIYNGIICFSLWLCSLLVGFQKDGARERRAKRLERKNPLSLGRVGRGMQLMQNAPHNKLSSQHSAFSNFRNCNVGKG